MQFNIVTCHPYADQEGRCLGRPFEQRYRRIKTCFNRIFPISSLSFFLGHFRFQLRPGRFFPKINCFEIRFCIWIRLYNMLYFQSTQYLYIIPHIVNLSINVTAPNTVPRSIQQNRETHKHITSQKGRY